MILNITFLTSICAFFYNPKERGKRDLPSKKFMVHGFVLRFYYIMINSVEALNRMFATKY